MSKEIVSLIRILSCRHVGYIQFHLANTHTESQGVDIQLPGLMSKMFIHGTIRIT